MNGRTWMADLTATGGKVIDDFANFDHQGNFTLLQALIQVLRGGSSLRLAERNHNDANRELLHGYDFVVVKVGHFQEDGPYLVVGSDGRLEEIGCIKEAISVGGIVKDLKDFTDGSLVFLIEELKVKSTSLYLVGTRLEDCISWHLRRIRTGQLDCSAQRKKRWPLTPLTCAECGSAVGDAEHLLLECPNTATARTAQYCDVELQRCLTLQPKTEITVAHLRRCARTGSRSH